MSQQLLAEEVVRITIEGLERAEQRLDAVEKKFNKTSEAAKKAKGFFGQLSESIDKIGKAAKLFAAGGALGLGGIAAIAMRGTVQAERFGRAIELAGRALGDGLAPYIEAATSGIMGLTNAWAGLSQETRAAATKWAVITTAVAGFLALLPLMVAGLSSVVAALAVIVSPLAMTIAALTGLGVVAVKTFGSMEDSATDASNQIDKANRNWVEHLIIWLKRAGVAMAEFWNKTIDAAIDATGWLAKKFGNQGGPWAKIFGQLQLGDRKTFKFDIEAVGQGFDELAKRAKAIAPDFAGWIDGANDIAKKMQAAFNNPANQHMRIKMTVGWESLQGTFDRLQKSFADQSGLNFQKAQLGQLQAINNGQQAAVAELGQIKDLLPVVR